MFKATFVFSLCFWAALLPAQAQTLAPAELNALHDTAWVELVRIDPDFVLDVRYATANNFTGQVLYPCGRVLLRKRVALDLVAAHREVKAQGYRMKIYDGYRPLDVQWKMWNLTPDKRYVGNPRKGSMHNRGCAVDLTLVDAQGKELDMGTAYDFFGKEAHTDYAHPPQVLANRKVLQNAMTRHGFRILDTEWWHFSHSKVYSISNFPMPCKP